MIKINEVPVGFPAKMANGIEIRMMPFQTTDLSCSTYYEMIGENSEILANGNSAISEDQFANWGQDMSYIENIILTNLGLTRIILK